MHPTSEDEGASMEMPRYRSHKQVWALEIATVYGNKLTFADSRYAPINCDVGMFSRYTPVPGDYYVVYDDGYKSFSPAKAFIEGYTLIDRAAEMRRAFDRTAEEPRQPHERKQRE